MGTSRWVVIACLSCAGLAGCDAPGEGRTAERAKRQADPITVALEAHHVSFGRYPRTLDELVPQYLSASQLNPPPGVRFRYVSNGAHRYDFEFQYSGPGSNRCINSEEDVPGQWTCSGLH